MSGKQGRISYKEAGKIGREAAERALKADLTKTAYRVLLALNSLICLYSRQEDHVSVNQLVDLTGLSRRSVTNALLELRETAIIDRQAKGGRTSGGRGYAGMTRILSNLEASRVQTYATLKGADIDPKGCRHSTQRVQSEATLLEGTREEYRGITVPKGESLLATPLEDTAQRGNPRTTLVTTDTVWCRCGVGFSGDDLHHAEDKYANHAGHCGDRPVYEPLYARPVHAA